MGNKIPDFRNYHNTSRRIMSSFHLDFYFVQSWAQIFSEDCRTVLSQCTLSNEGLGLCPVGISALERNRRGRPGWPEEFTTCKNSGSKLTNRKLPCQGHRACATHTHTHTHRVFLAHHNHPHHHFSSPLRTWRSV